MILSRILVLGVAMMHLFILWIEMFRWETAGSKIVRGATPDFMKATRAMAANQGLYNGFLAAGLIWAFISGISGEGGALAVFFLGCVTAAGIYGGVTANRGIFFKQGVPALLGLISVLCFGI